MPSRWTNNPELVKNASAWSPFLHGSSSCIGKNLALLELRTVTAKLITRFDVQFAPGEDGSRLLTKTLDHFTLTPGDLKLIFEERRDF